MSPCVFYCYGMSWVWLVLLCTPLVLGGHRPVVLLHGIFGSTSDMTEAVQWIEADFPGIYAVSVEIGNGVMDR